ncbi:type IV secretory pathway VirB10-like protein [Duganella sp. 1411]|uniref:hypothetical protein n=1 Tax=Duganella sp. 1411 TaxID=2806572 RepID=UPI001AE6D8D1|nr:hypothetical protein [Duganella sp. 1411]MBP1205867.1 type IV secretory pathway VirB10-like protein [Duganella sp. 1411]
MNATLDESVRPRRPGMVWGVAVSVVLHALLIFGYRSRTPEAPPPREAMTVWLAPPPKPPAPVVVELKPPPVEPAHPRERDKKVVRADKPAPKPAAEEAPSQAITLPAPAANVPDPLYPQQAQQQAKQFDMNAALKTARKVANEKDPARAGLPVAQLDDHPLYPEQKASELATKMEGAKRKDCLAQPGNLLTPLFWLLDKKDHGCKF